MEFVASMPGSFSFYCSLTQEDGCRNMRGEKERQAGMIVVGLMSEQAGKAARPGSIAYRLLCLAHVPVFVVPPSSMISGAPAG